MEPTLHRWPHVGRAFQRVSVPPLLGGLFVLSPALMAVGVIGRAGAAPSLAAQSPLMRQWAGTSRAQVLGPDVPLVGESGFSSTGDDSSGMGSEDDLRTTGVASVDSPLAVAGESSDSVDILLLGGRSATLLGGPSFVTQSSTGPNAPPCPLNSQRAESPAASSDASFSGPNLGSGSAFGESSSDGSSGGNVTVPPPSETELEPTIPVEARYPVPEAAEQRICATLLSEYDVLQVQAARVYKCIATYEHHCLTTGWLFERSVRNAAQQIPIVQVYAFSEALF